MKILVHIGCAKGGSSAIQQFLRENAEALSAAGYCVPTTDLTEDGAITGHQIEYFQLLNQMSPEDAIDSLKRRLRGIVEANPSAEAILLSAENLCNPVGFDQIFAALLDDFDVQVLMYVRRQDDYISSAWQQWYVKGGGSLTAWLSENVGVVADWYSYLAPWKENVGRERLNVRRYGNDYFHNGSIFDDYCSFVDETLDIAAFERPNHLVNRSLNADVSRWVEGRGEFFEGPHDNDYYGFLYRMGGPALVDKTTTRPLFTADEELAIMKRYLRSNELVRQTFLPESERPLFTLKKPGAARAANEEANDDVTRRIVALEGQLYRVYRELVKRDVI